MKKKVWVLGMVMLGAIFFSPGRGDGQPQELREEQNSVVSSDKELALRFIRGLQDGDKNEMYEASNLTAAIIDDSRYKLIHTRKDKLTGQQRLEFEHVLRISGQIDFFIAKIKSVFPKSSRAQVLRKTTKESTGDIRHNAYLVKITYMKKGEAIRDKKGKLVREMVFPLQQLTRSVNGRSIHAFSFDSKIADRDFEVLSYF